MRRTRCARPRAQRGDRHPGAGQLGVHRLGERGDERLGRRVGGHARQRLKARERADVEHRAGAAGDHARQQRPGQVMQRVDVDAHLVALALESAARGSGRPAEARRYCRRRDLARPPPSAAISRSRAAASPRSHARVGLDAVRGAQLAGQRHEPLAPAQRARPVAARGERARQLGPDARRGPGDDDGGRREGGGAPCATLTPAMDVWTHDRWRFPLPERHKFPIDKYALLRERVVAEGSPRRARCTSRPGGVGAPRARCTSARCCARIRRGELTVREQRGLGLPWSPELVERGRRAVGGTVAAARTPSARARHEPRRRHPPRRPRLRPRLLPVQRRRRRARGAARRGGARRAVVVDCDVHQGDGTAQLLGAGPATRSRSRCTARATTPSTASPPTSTSTCQRHRRRRATSSRSTRRSTSRSRAAPDRRLLPRRRRPVGGRPPRPPGADQGRPARPRRARARPPARCRRARSASCSPAATPRRPRHCGHQRRHGGRGRARGPAISRGRGEWEPLASAFA